MKVLQINCVYGTGSTGRLVQQLHTDMGEQGIASVVLYGRGRAVSAPGVSKVCSDLYAKGCKLISACTGLRYGSCLLSTAALERRIEQENPDVVHLQCINGNFVNIYRLVDWLKRRGIPTVLTLHAEFMFTGSCSHAYACDGWLHGCRRCPDGRRASGALTPPCGAAGLFRICAFDGRVGVPVAGAAGGALSHSGLGPAGDHRQRRRYGGILPAGHVGAAAGAGPWPQAGAAVCNGGF